MTRPREQGKLHFEWIARYGIDYRDRLPHPYLDGLQRTGMFDQFETFNFQAFVQRANWPAFSALLISMFALIFLFLLLEATTQLGDFSERIYPLASATLSQLVVACPERSRRTKV